MIFQPPLFDLGGNGGPVGGEFGGGNKIRFRAQLLDGGKWNRVGPVVQQGLALSNQSFILNLALEEKDAVIFNCGWWWHGRWWIVVLFWVSGSNRRAWRRGRTCRRRPLEVSGVSPGTRMCGVVGEADTLIGICFLDAPRFRENCFCAGFTFPLFYAFLSAPQGFFSGLSANAESASGFSCHKPARRRLSGPKPTAGDHTGAHPTGGRSRRRFTRRTGSGQSVRTFS